MIFESTAYLTEIEGKQTVANNWYYRSKPEREWAELCKDQLNPITEDGHEDLPSNIFRSP